MGAKSLADVVEGDIMQNFGNFSGLDVNGRHHREMLLCEMVPLKDELLMADIRGGATLIADVAEGYCSAHLQHDTSSCISILTNMKILYSPELLLLTICLSGIREAFDRWLSYYGQMVSEGLVMSWHSISLCI